MRNHIQQADVALESNLTFLLTFMQGMQQQLVITDIQVFLFSNWSLKVNFIVLSNYDKVFNLFIKLCVKGQKDLQGKF